MIELVLECVGRTANRICGETRNRWCEFGYQFVQGGRLMVEFVNFDADLGDSEGFGDGAYKTLPKCVRV